MLPPSSNSKNLQREIGKRQHFDVPEQEAYLNLVRTHAALSRQFARMFKQAGLSEPQYNALRIIAAAGASGVRSETVGEQMVALDPDTTRLIDRLEKAGFVARSRHESDRRCVVVKITPEGRRVLKKLSPQVEALHRDQLGHLTRAELKQFNNLLFAARHA